MPDPLKEAKKAEAAGDYLKAGDMLLLGGAPRQAITMYLKGGHYANAARLMEKDEDWIGAARYYDRAKKYEKAADLYLKVKDYKNASFMYESFGDFARACDMAQKAADLPRAATLADKGELWDRAAELYVQVQNYERAAEIFTVLLSKIKQVTEGTFLESHSGRIRKYANSAGSLYFRLQQYEKAAKFFEEGESPAKAAEAYAKAERFERAAELYAGLEDYNAASAMFEKTGKILKAAEMAEKAGDFGRAAVLFERIGQPAKAAPLYIQAEKLEKAAELYFQLLIQSVEQKNANKYMESSRINLRKLGNTAGNLYSRLQNHKKAGWCFEEAELFSKAAECYSTAQMPGKAAECYYRMQNYEKAYESLTSSAGQIQNQELLGDICYGMGRYQEAGDIYVLVKLPAKAADAYEKGENLYKAAVLYEEVANDQKAADLYARLKESKKAAQLYERMKNYAEAARLYEEAGDLEKATGCYLHTEQKFHTAELLAKKGDTQRAISLLQEIGRGDEQFSAACALLGDLFSSMGMHSVALQKFTEAVEDRPVSKGNMEVYYNLAKTYEDLSQYSKAQDVYERILSVQYNFKDVLERLRNVRLAGAKGETSALEADPSAVRRVLDSYKKTEAEPPSVIPSEDLHRTKIEKMSLVGKWIREYEILEMIGRGGMGAVYRARHVYLDKERAIKVIESQISNLNFTERFIREAKILSDLHNPHLVQLFEFGTLEGDFFFMVMELITGESVKQRIQRCARIPIGESIRIIREAALGLHAAHQKGIIHRDIAPDNLMLVKDSQGKEITKVIDFGIAKTVMEESTSFTHANMFIGKPEYASPEQCGFLPQGEVIDHRSDLYSLAITFYNMVTGKSPFYSPTPQGYLVLHATQEPKPPSEQFPLGEFPEALDRLILKGLSKKREKRYASMEEFVRELDKIR